MDEATSEPTSVEACPGCGCMPGDGRTPGCCHPDGCGYQGADADAAEAAGFRVLSAAMAEAQALVGDRIAAALGEQHRLGFVEGLARGIERGRREAHERAEATIATASVGVLEALVEELEEAATSAEDAAREAKDSDKKLSRDLDEVVEWDVDLNAVEHVKVPTEDESFEEMADFLSSHGGSTFLDAEDINKIVNIDSCSVTVSEAAEHAEQAHAFICNVLKRLKPLVAELESSIDTTERDFEEAGRLTDSAVADAHADDD